MVAEVSRNSAVILCSHVANGEPVLLAIRTEPENENDSGWQFLCNCHEEDWKDAKVCSVSEALVLEPALNRFIDHPPGISVVRGNASLEWKKGAAL